MALISLSLEGSGFVNAESFPSVNVVKTVQVS